LTTCNPSGHGRATGPVCWCPTAETGTVYAVRPAASWAYARRRRGRLLRVFCDSRSEGRWRRCTSAQRPPRGPENVFAATSAPTK
jgi:hypothetical protein